MTLIADLWSALTGKVHPRAPKKPTRNPASTNRLLLARRRRRRRQLEAMS